MLPDVLSPGMKIVFCGHNGGENQPGGIYYSQAGDRFWSIIHKVGLTPVCAAPAEFAVISSFGLGLIDPAGQGLREKIARWQPAVLCFNGKQPAKAFFGRRNIELGWQTDNIGSTRVFVAPSTAASAGRYWDEQWWFTLADSVGVNVTRIDVQNYFQPDRAGHRVIRDDHENPGDSGPTEKDYIAAVEDIRLCYSIPLHIRNMFEIARALFVYGYLFFPFCSLAIEQALKSLEALITHRYDLAGGGRANRRGYQPAMAEKINSLYAKRIITRPQKEILHDCRLLRNMAFHPRYQQVLDHYDGALRTIAGLMNEIWTAKK